MLLNTTGKVVVLFALSLSSTLNGVTQTTSSNVPATTLSQAVQPVTLAITVINKRGNFVTGLQRDNFRIAIDKNPAEIIDFREDDAPLSVGIIFDASGSVGNPQSPKTAFKSTQQALASFLEASNQANEYFLMAFNNKPQLLLDWTSDAKAIIEVLGGLQPKGKTAFYDACYLAINKVQHGRYSKRVLILISDGEDNLSTYTFNQVRDELKASGVLVYSVNFSRADDAGSVLGMEGQEFLKELSLLSGGMSFYQEYGGSVAKKATSIFELFAQELRHQYTIAITPRVSSDNKKWHRIKIKVQPAPHASGEMKQLSARTREGFYLNHR